MAAESAARRIGLIIVGDEILSGRRQDKHFSKVVELLSARGMQLGWAEFLPDDRDTLVAALRRDLPEAEFSPPEGGYFMWVVLPEEISVAELETAAAERGVIFVKGTDFLLEGGENTLRLAYSGVTPAQIDEGISRLAEAVHSLGVTT